MQKFIFAMPTGERKAFSVKKSENQSGFLKNNRKPNKISSNGE